MGFHAIKLDEWNRAEIFKHYSTQVPCTYSMTVNLDISALLEQVRANGQKFFPVFLYGLSMMVNCHQEFRMATDSQGNIGYYDKVNPSYTVFHPQTKTFSSIWTEYTQEFSEFYNNYVQDMAQFGDNKNFMGKPIYKNNLFNVSSIPWASFTQFHLNLQKGYDYYLPIFTTGRYFEQNGRWLLPLAVQVHHAVCDGFHTTRFINDLQAWANNFSI